MPMLGLTSEKISGNTGICADFTTTRAGGLDVPGRKEG